MVQESNVKRNIAKNLAHYRKLYGMTQAELAEHINYSDKSVSKWERGEGIPDVYVLAQLAEFFDVTMDDLICEGRPPRPKGKIKKRIIIPIMSVVIVWLVTTVAYMALKLSLPELGRTWLAFLYAIPVSCIVLLVFLKMWWNMWSRFASVTVLVWSAAVCVYLTVSMKNMGLIFIVASIIQLLVILWYILKYNPRYEKRRERHRVKKLERQQRHARKSGDAGADEGPEGNNE